MKKYIFCLIIIIIICYLLNDTKEYFTNNIIFITKYEGIEKLIKNEDRYYQTFNHNDLQVRNIQNIYDYSDKIKVSVIDFPQKIQIKLSDLINKVKTKINNMNYTYFDGKKANNIEWKLICIQGKEYEYGLPHTRNDVIILPLEYIVSNTDNNIMITLFHELIHVYQKKYPNDIQEYLNKYGYTKVKKRNDIKNIRANPDLDDWIYKDNNNTIHCGIYNNNPTNILDVVYYPNNNSNSEHPYEQMAYELSKEL
jgi:hypothetical protein